MKMAIHCNLLLISIILWFVSVDSKYLTSLNLQLLPKVVNKSSAVRLQSLICPVVLIPSPDGDGLGMRPVHA